MVLEVDTPPSCYGVTLLHITAAGTALSKTPFSTTVVARYPGMTAHVPWHATAQVAPYDARHTLTTICRAERHPHLREAQQPVGNSTANWIPNGSPAPHKALLQPGECTSAERMALTIPRQQP